MMPTTLNIDHDSLYKGIADTIVALNSHYLQLIEDAENDITVTGYSDKMSQASTVYALIEFWNYCKGT